MSNIYDVFLFSAFLHLIWSSLCPSMLLQMALLHYFYGWVIFHCVYAPCCPYPFLCWCTFRLLPWPGYCKVLQWTLGCICFWVMFFSRYVPRTEIAGSYGHSVFSFVKNLHAVLHRECSTFPPAVWEGSLFSIPSAAFVVCGLWWQPQPFGLNSEAAPQRPALTSYWLQASL